MEERGCAREERTGGVGGPFEKLRSSLWSEVNVSTGSTSQTERERDREGGGDGGRLEALSQGYRSVYKLGHSQCTAIGGWEARKGEEEVGGWEVEKRFPERYRYRMPDSRGRLDPSRG